MKTFKEYLTESKRLYNFKVRIAGALPESAVETLKTSLARYNVESCSAGKRSPIQETLIDFPTIKNAEVTFFEVDLAYPTNSVTVQATIAEALNISSALVKVTTPGEEYERSVNNEYVAKPGKDKDKPSEALLMQDYPESPEGQKLVGTEHSMNLLKGLGKKKTTGTQYTGVNDQILAKKSPKLKGPAAMEAEKLGNTSPVGSRQNKIPDPFKGN